MASSPLNDGTIEAKDACFSTEEAYNERETEEMEEKDEDSVTPNDTKNAASASVFSEPTEESAMKPPAAKKPRVSANYSGLLECRPEILRNIYSFLTLQEALEVRRTCRQFHNNSVDVFRYSNIMDRSALTSYGITEPEQVDKYMKIQWHVLCNLGSNDSLRAVIENKALPYAIVVHFMKSLVDYSATDNGEAVSLLLDSGRCSVTPELLDIALKKDFTAMATALLKSDAVTRFGIEMCNGGCPNRDIFPSNIGCYGCCQRDSCYNWVPGTSSFPSFQAKYCRSCVLADDRFCKGCNEYLCSDCYYNNSSLYCEKCGSVFCTGLYSYACREGVRSCDGPGDPACNRTKCKSCIAEDGDNWVEVRIENSSVREYCPCCVEQGFATGEDYF